MSKERTIDSIRDAEMVALCCPEERTTSIGCTVRVVVAACRPIQTLRAAVLPLLVAVWVGAASAGLPHSVAQARRLLKDGLRVSDEQGTTEPEAVLESRMWSIAAQIRPRDFEKVVSGDRDDRFRISALFQFGWRISPDRTFKTLSHLAAHDRNERVRAAAFFDLEESLAAGHLQNRKQEMETIAIRGLAHRRTTYSSIRILGLIHTRTAIEALRKVSTGNYSKTEKEWAANSIRSKGRKVSE